MPWDLTNAESVLFQVMDWCHQATSHYLNQCWLRSLAPYGITGPQWIKILWNLRLRCGCHIGLGWNESRPEQNLFHARLRLKSPASLLFTQPFIRAQIKVNIKAPRHWPLCGEFTGDRWIPRTNGQLRGKCFHLMTSSWYLVQCDWSKGDSV